MNWVAFILLGYGAMGLQTGLGSFARLGSSDGGAAPNFGLIALVFIALNANWQAALLGGFILGALQDLATQQPFGLFAFSYGLAAMAIASVAQSVYRLHPLTHFFCTLMAGCLTALILSAHGWARHVSVPLVTTFAGALYTAILAPFLIGGLQKMRKLFAFSR
jgi:rod shape-determining protein MreD